MHYKVRTTRNEDGTYALAYGKGAKKLQAQVSKIDGKWVATMDGSNGDPHKTKREAIAEWSAWAVENYGGETDNDPTTPATEPAAEPVVEDRTVTALTGETNKVVATEAGTTVKQDDTPLPNVGPGPAIVATEKYEVREHKPNDRFPYEGGFAIVERKTNIQFGWSKGREQAFESLFNKV